MAYGDLGAVIDTLTYFDQSSRGNECCVVSGATCAVTCHFSYPNTLCYTFSIDPVGNISDTIIDQLSLNPEVTEDAICFAKLNPSLYAICTRDNHFRNQVDTWNIWADGSMPAAVSDHHAFSPDHWHTSSLKKVGATYLALAMRNDAGNLGQIWTIQVYGDGIIEHDIVDTMTFISTYCRGPQLAEMHPGIWALVFRGPSDRANARTVSISPAGILGSSPIDTIVFSGGTVSGIRAVKARDNFLAVTNQNQGGGGTLYILEISESGMITDSPVDVYAFEAGTAFRPYPFSIGLGYIGVAYRNAAAHGILKTFLVDESGSVNDTTIDTLDYCTDGSNTQIVFHVTGDVWAVCHEAAATTGRVTSFGLETPPTPGGPKDLMRGMYR